MINAGDGSEDGKSSIKQCQDEVDHLKAKSLIGTAICEKLGFELIELEEAVKNDGGCWVKFIKVPATNPQAQVAAGKGAPPKGKGAPVDEAKPTFGKAWMDLSELQKPGSQ